MTDLRTLTPADHRLWHDLRLAALTDAPHAFKAGLADWHTGGAERWRARLDDPHSHQVAALLDGTPAGLAAGMPGPAPHIRELRSLWIAPPARGRGVADALITEIARWSRTQHATTLHLAALPTNTPALALYHRHGFTLLTDYGAELTLAKPLL
ncbi:GNAT family N-acetyltransferase [Kitasatospora sp. NPDC101183]|uniref:GNAT family N-acetyltransferase n=1 Tax=Kitasatospora sp. NPDC101183 TaxID=3364100 RepID=UPI0037F896AE